MKIHENTRGRILTEFGVLLMMLGVVGLGTKWSNLNYSSLTFNEFMFSKMLPVTIDWMLGVFGLLIFVSGVIVLLSKEETAIILSCPKDSKYLVLIALLLTILIGVVIYLSFFYFGRLFGFLFGMTTLFMIFWGTYFIILKKFKRKYDSV